MTSLLDLEIVDSVFDPFLTVRDKNALLNGNKRTLKDVFACTHRELTQLRNFGAVGMANVERLRAWFVSTSGDDVAQRVALLRMAYGSDESSNPHIRLLLAELDRLVARLHGQGDGASA